MDAKRIKSGVNLLSSRWTQNVSKERCETRSPSSWRRFKRNKSDVTRSIRVVSAFIICSFIRTAPLSPHTATLTGMAQLLARGAHNPEVTGSNPVSGIYHLQFIRTAPLSPHTATLTPLAQRQSTLAHNSGVTRSKLVGGIYHSPYLQNLVVKLDVKGSKH